MLYVSTARSHAKRLGAKHGGPVLQWRARIRGGRDERGAVGN